MHRAEELACRRAGKVPVPQHRCLVPAQLPLSARAPEQELARLCSLPPWERPCWGQVPALSSPVIQAASCPPPMGPPLPACRGNVIVASSRVRSLAPALPRATGPLTHQAAAAGPWTPCRAPVESCSPGEPRPPPRPPWGGWGVSPPSCGTEERGRGGKGGSFSETPRRCEAAGGVRKTWAALGGSSPSPCSCPVPSLSCRTLWAVGRSHTEHMQCSGVSQREVTKGPTVMRCPGREGQGVPWGGTEPAQRWAPGCSWGASRPRFALMSPRDLLLPSAVSQSPMFRHPGMLPGHPFPFGTLQSPASPPRPCKM